MSGVEKWLAGITGLAIIATVVSNRNSAAVLNSLFGGVSSLYRTAMAR